jgi:hypothetical protein
MHIISTTDNPRGADELKGALDKIGPEHFIGGYTGEDGKPKTDASYILHSNDLDEVQNHLIANNQEAAFTIKPDNTTSLTYRKSINA